MRERRSCTIVDVKNVKFNLTDILKGNIHFDLDENYIIQIYDDRLCDKENDMEILVEKISYYFPNYDFLEFKNFHSKSYKKLLELKQNKNINLRNLTLTLRDYNIDIYPDILPVTISIDDVSKIPYKNIDKVEINERFSSIKRRHFDDKILDTKTLLEGIDYIAKQISKYAQNDIQKILLLDKMLRENVSFDWYYTDDKELRETLKKQATKEGFITYPGHVLQTLLLKRCCVCSSIASFATIVLRHPLLNVDIRNVNGKAYGDFHAYNKIYLNGHSYLYDFTHNITRDFNNEMLHSFVKRPSEYHTINDDDFENYETMPREIIANEYEKIKNIHIKMPSYEEPVFNVRYGDTDEKKEINDSLNKI